VYVCEKGCVFAQKFNFCLCCCLQIVCKPYERMGQRGLQIECNRSSFWQGNPQIYGQKRYIYTVLANPSEVGIMVPRSDAQHVRAEKCALCSDV